MKKNEDLIKALKAIRNPRLPLPTGFQRRIRANYNDMTVEWDLFSKDDMVAYLLATKGDTVAERFHRFALPAWNDGDVFACCDEIYDRIASLLQILSAIEYVISKRKKKEVVK